MASFTTTFMAGGGFVGWSGFRELVRKDAKVPVAEVQTTQTFESCLYNGAENLCGRRILIECRAHSLKLGRAHRLPEDFGVEARLISEVVVDGGDVCARSIADFSDSGVMKTKLSEHFSGSLD